MSKQRKWHKGPPPHIGWWNASTLKDQKMWRWWDGRMFGNAVNQSNSDVQAANYGKTIFQVEQDHIEWTDYYPEDARVPRIDPGSTS